MESRGQRDFNGPWCVGGFCGFLRDPFHRGGDFEPKRRRVADRAPVCRGAKSVRALEGQARIGGQPDEKRAEAFDCQPRGNPSAILPKRVRSIRLLTIYPERPAQCFFALAVCAGNPACRCRGRKSRVKSEPMAMPPTDLDEAPIELRASAPRAGHDDEREVAGHGWRRRSSWTGREADLGGFGDGFELWALPSSLEACWRIRRSGAVLRDQSRSG